VELAVNGIGERAGNTSFEEVVMALRIHGERMGVHMNVDTRGIWELSQMVRERSGMPIAPNKAIVGENAFRHASGIHQDGMLKAKSTFESIEPEWIGHPRGTEIVLGKLSGRAGFASRLSALGITLDAARFESVFAEFQAVADHERSVSDVQIRELLGQVGI
jgi:2-isopropylmalate synthase